MLRFQFCTWFRIKLKSRFRKHGPTVDVRAVRAPCPSSLDLIVYSLPVDLLDSSIIRSCMCMRTAAAMLAGCLNPAKIACVPLNLIDMEYTVAGVGSRVHTRQVLGTVFHAQLPRFRYMSRNSILTTSTSSCKFACLKGWMWSSPHHKAKLQQTRVMLQFKPIIALQQKCEGNQQTCNKLRWEISLCKCSRTCKARHNCSPQRKVSHLISSMH